MSAKSNKKVKLAFFDIDGTIFRSSLLVELIDALVEQKIVSRKAKKDIEKEYLAWLDRKGSYDNYIWKVIQTHSKYIRNKPYDEVKEVARQVIKKMKNRVYRYTRDLIKDLTDGDYHLVAISGSPAYIVSEFVHKWGFHSYFGTPYEVKNGKFTGKTKNTDSFDNKIKLVNEMVERFSGNVDLKGSIAIGDTLGDITMLEMVGKPIAFNPNTALALEARKRGWRIVVERKDVIFRVTKFEFLNREL